MDEYYVAQSPTTDPGEYGDFLAGIPRDLAEIAKVTQGLIYHYIAGPLFYGWDTPTARLPELNTRTLHNMLETLYQKMIGR